MGSSNIPEVRGTYGNIVQYEVLGVAEAIRIISQTSQQIKDGMDLGVFQGAVFVQEEIKESIAGNRGETRSVDTGRFLNSVSLQKISDGVYEVFTDVEYAPDLEYGNSKGMEPRRHFGNTASRTQKKVHDNVKIAVQRAAK